MNVDAAVPNPMQRPHVVFTITSGWGIRNFVQSGVFAKLSEHADISVVTTSALRPYFEPLLAEGRIRELLAAPEGEPLVWRLVRQARKAIFQAVHDIDTARIKRASSGNKFLRGAQRLSWQMQRAMSAQWQLTWLDGIERKFCHFGPAELPTGATVLLNTSPFDPRDNQVQRTARRRGLITIGIIPSWDNPSSKGCILPDTDTVMVWSPVQKAEILGYYPGFCEDQLIISGIPQFEVYRQQLRPEGERAAFLGSLGIAPEKQVILFSTGSPKLFQHEPAILEHLVDALEAGLFGPNAHILVRCHPVDPSERYAASEQRECVTISPSSLPMGGALATWRPPETELDILAATLSHCAVCVNTASTMTLDAASCDRPVVNIAYDPVEPEPPHRTVKRFYCYSHYSKVVSWGFASIASSREELIKAVAAALAEERPRCAERARFVAAFCPAPPGGSIAFIAEQIAKAAVAEHGRLPASPSPALDRKRLARSTESVGLAQAQKP